MDVQKLIPQDAAIKKSLRYSEIDYTQSDTAGMLRTDLGTISFTIQHIFLLAIQTKHCFKASQLFKDGVSTDIGHIQTPPHHLDGTRSSFDHIGGWEQHT